MRFPRFHIATSAVNRILDLADQELMAAQPTAKDSYQIPDTQQQGAALDKALQTPPPAVPAPVGSEETIAVEAMQGGSAADAVGSLAALDALA